MSRGWMPSGLKVGTRVHFDTDIFEGGDQGRSRLKTATYIGETETGLTFELVFEDGFGTIYPGKWRYKRFIPWASIYVGHVKVKANGEEVIARRALFAKKRDMIAYWAERDIICGKV